MRRGHTTKMMVVKIDLARIAVRTDNGPAVSHYVWGLKTGAPVIEMECGVTLDRSQYDGRLIARTKNPRAMWENYAGTDVARVIEIKPDGDVPTCPMPEPAYGRRSIYDPAPIGGAVSTAESKTAVPCVVVVEYTKFR